MERIKIVLCIAGIAAGVFFLTRLVVGLQSLTP